MRSQSLKEAAMQLHEAPESPKPFALSLDPWYCKSPCNVTFPEDCKEAVLLVVSVDCDG